MCTFMFTVALFIKCGQNMWKQPKHPSTDEWINQLWDIHIEHYSAMNKNEVWIHATVCMNFKTMRRERSQSQRPHINDSVYTKYLEQVNPQRRKADWWLRQRLLTGSGLSF